MKYIRNHTYIIYLYSNIEMFQAEGLKTAQMGLSEGLVYHEPELSMSRSQGALVQHKNTGIKYKWYVTGRHPASYFFWLMLPHLFIDRASINPMLW